jgi:hypothetical protein
VKRWHTLSTAAVLSLVLSLGFSSCAGLGSYEAGRGDSAAAPAKRSAVAEASAAFEAPAELQAADVADAGSMGRGGGPHNAGEPVPAAVPEQPSAERLRVYSAELELLVARVESARETVIGTAEEAGGYVESSAGEFITIRVPAERFDAVLEQIERVGEIRSRAVRTADVTEQYADLDRRIALAERTRERFYALLERTTDTEERVEVLREIRRLTERIERLRAQLESLDRQIDYSRITVRLVARIQDGGPGRADIPFPWIAALDPLERTTREPDSRPAVELPADYAVFDTGRLLRAETAEGVRIRIGAVENDPRGNTAFWQQALVFHLGDFYTVSEELEAGPLRGALFEAKGPRAYSYLVIVAARGAEIIVAEVFFPTADARDARLGEIREALSEVGL